MALPILSPAEAFTQQQLLNAKIGDINADAGMKLTEILLGKQALDARAQQGQAAQIMGQMYSQLQTQNASMQANPNTPSLDAIQARNDERNPQEAELRRLQQDRQKYQTLLDLSIRTVPGSTYPKLWQDAIEKTDIDIRQVQQQVLTKRADTAKQVAQVLKGVDSQEALDAGLQFIADTYGPQEAAGVYRTLAKDPTTGRPLYNDDTIRALKPYTDQQTSVHEANTLTAQIAKQKEDKARDDERERHNREREDRDNARLRQMQEGLEIRERAETRREQELATRTQAQLDKANSIASKPANEVQKKSARAVVTADPDYEGIKFDASLDALAADVADRANKIRADGIRAGEDPGFEQARRDAWEELKPFVQVKDQGGIVIPKTDWRIGGEKRASYVRAAGMKANAEASSKDDLALMQQLDKAGIKASVAGGKVTATGAGGPVQIASKAQYDALPTGTRFVGPDGKEWTKP